MLFLPTGPAGPSYSVNHVRNAVEWAEKNKRPPAEYFLRSGQQAGGRPEPKCFFLPTQGKCFFLPRQKRTVSFVFSARSRRRCNVIRLMDGAGPGGKRHFCRPGGKKRLASGRPLAGSLARELNSPDRRLFFPPGRGKQFHICSV